MNKKLKFLINQNLRTTTKFLSFLIKNIKHFIKEKKIKTGVLNLYICSSCIYLFLNLFSQNIYYILLFYV